MLLLSPESGQTLRKPLNLQGKMKLAERGGFEPPIRLLTVYRFSKPAPSATRPSLHWQSNRQVFCKTSRPRQADSQFAHAGASPPISRRPSQSHQSVLRKTKYPGAQIKWLVVNGHFLSV